jgi:tetratricopeptide (TPR) repeat protein
MGRIYKLIGSAVVVGASVLAQAVPQNLDMSKLQEQLDQATRAAQQVDMSKIQEQMAAAERAMQHVDMSQINLQMDRARMQFDVALPALNLSLPQINLSLDQIGARSFNMESMLAFAPFQNEQADRVREQADRVREARDRVREQADRVRENEERKIEWYAEGKESIDENRYDRAVQRFNQLLESDSKWSRADGVYYWKAYALNRLGKRDEALAAVAEIAKQFPQSRWVNDAKALQVEIQQSSGRPVSPDSIDDQDLRLLAINSLMNSDSATAIPLVEKVLNDPKNNLALKSKALFVLAQSRTDKAREVVTAYAKNGSNPDLQIKAVQYLGTFRAKDSTQALADIYAANTNVDVRRAVLRSMAISRDSAHLFTSAKTETNVDLRREAIRSLGSMQASNELAQLYATETNTELKASILQSIMASRGGDRLLEIAKNEKNAELRGDAIRFLGSMRNEKTGDALASLYANESDKTVKDQIIRTLGSQGQGKQLVEITRNEKDPELKRAGVQWLGRMHGSKEATDYLMELISK